VAGSGTAHLRPDDEALLAAEDLVVEFPVGNTGLKVHAVSGISIDVAEGETLGLVGESGCGKSTTGRAILQSPAPTAGEVRFEQRALTSLDPEAMRRTRPRLQMIFQDPISSLNPRRTIRDVVAEPLDIWWAESFPRPVVARAFDDVSRWIPPTLRRVWRYAHYGLPVAGLAFAFWVVSEAVEGKGSEDWLGWTQVVAAVLAIVAGVFLVPFAIVFAAMGLLWLALGILAPITGIPRRIRMLRDRRRHRAEADQKVTEVLDSVGIDTSTALNRKPHEFSGGQAQRISIARALILEPKVIICDEPVSALDVSVQAQILNLLQEMKRRYGLTLVFIAHDLAVVKNVSDRVAVMYLGKLCEVGDPDVLYEQPAHPYTAALLSAIPIPDPNRRPEAAAGVHGELPSPIAPPSGCRFRTRCPRATDRCADEEPQIGAVGEDHYVACHYPIQPGEAVEPATEHPVIVEPTPA